MSYIIGVSGYTFGVVVPAGSPFKTFEDLVEWARANPGKLRLLVTWGERRTRRWPDVPTLQELGYGIVSNSPYGLGTSKGVDPAVVRILHDAFKKGLEDPKHLATLERYDQDLCYRSSADYAEYARQTFVKERALMERLGLAKV